jgi:hypothetical protein
MRLRWWWRWQGDRQKQAESLFLWHNRIRLKEAIMGFAPVEYLFDDILEFLSSTPTPLQIVEYQPPQHLQEWLTDLLDKNRNNRLTDAEATELNEFLRMNRFMSRLKLKARQKLER